MYRNRDITLTGSLQAIKGVRSGNGQFEDCVDFNFVPRSGKGQLGTDSGVRVLSPVGEYGRTGNKIHAALNLFTLASKYCCAIRLPSNMVEGWEPAEYHWKPATCSNSDKAQCRPVNAKEAYFLEPGIGVSQRKCAVNMVRRYFGINNTHVLGQQCPKTTFNTIHIRAGDITSGTYNKSNGHFIPAEVHADYGPFPSSYFMNTALSMREAGKTAILVICEDFSNPSCDTFRNMEIIDKNIKVLSGRTLVEDLRDLLCATEVASSFGTFRVLFELSTHMRVRHEFSENPLQNDLSTCKGDCMPTKFYWIDEPDLRKIYLQKLRRRNWKNTEYQRHLVDRHYPIGSAVIRTPRLAA